MDSKLKQRWFKALRGKRYLKGKDALCSLGGDGKTKRYCCLGVLCEIAVKDGIIKPARKKKNFEDLFIYGVNSDQFLPTRVARWAGLSTLAQEGIASKNDCVDTFEEVIPTIKEWTK